MNEILFTVLEGVIITSLIVVMRFVVPYLKLKLQGIIDASLWNAIVKEVKSVEQTIIGNKLGEVKKEEVLLRITEWANQHNIKITEKQISQLIEAAVWIMNHEEKWNE